MRHYVTFCKLAVQLERRQFGLVYKLTTVARFDDEHASLQIFTDVPCIVTAVIVHL